MIFALGLALLAQDPMPPTVELAPPEALSELEQKCLDQHGEKDEAGLKECLGIVDPLEAPIEEVEADIAQLHPSQFYMLAARLFNDEARPEDALFWFYAGQLRWRIQLACTPPEPGGEGALFGAMQAVVGESINQYALSDTDNWLATIQRVLDWETANPDPLLPSTCDAEREKGRAGLADFAKQIEELSAKGEL